MSDAPAPRWNDVNRVVDQALDLEPTARTAFVERICSPDWGLQSAVERLLRSIARADGAFLTQSAAADLAPLLSWLARQGLAPGTRFGAYELLGELGRGGMAIVYLAQDHKHHRRVAVKVLHQDIAAAVGREWFLREIEIAAALHHPHILPLHDSGVVDGLLYYVMPHVEGESLRARLTREGRIPLVSARRIVQEVAGALDYAHRQGVVHRDIKPENILLQDGQAIVADFGIARAIATGVVEAGTADTIPAVGTPAYMSPEQAAGAGPLDGRTDIYALGCVLYEMLEGAPPFTGPTAEAVLARHASDPAPPVTYGSPSRARQLQQVIHRALAKEPSRRFATPGELAFALEGAEDEPVSRSRWRDRWRSLASAVAVVLVVALALTLRGGTKRSAAQTPGDPDIIAVLPFRVAVASRELGWMQQGVADLVAAKLTGDSGLRAAEPRLVAAAWRMLGASRADPTPEAVVGTGRRVGAGRVIDGTVVGSPAHLTVTASLLATADGRQLAHASVEGSSDTLPALLDRLTGRLLALSAGSDSVRLAGLPAVALPALRAYLLGRDAFRRGRTDQASDRMQQATVLDSTFAVAALELLHLRRGGEDGRRARRLAIAGRARLVPADQALLDIWTGPFPTGPEWIDRWQNASAAFPGRPETWYGLGDAYFHDGLSAGVTDPFRYAAEAFQRGLTADSAEQGEGPRSPRPFVATEPLRHLVEIAQGRGDTAAVRRLVARGLAGDSTTKEGWYLRWQRAVALGDSSRRAFWTKEPAVDPGAFGLMFEFIESSGIATKDYVRTAELDTRQWEASGPAGGLFERGMVALDGGRPRESARLLSEIEDAGTPGTGGRPMGWRLGEGGDPGIVGLALYWGADTARAATAARRLAPLARGVSLTGDEARNQLEARCVVATWRAAHGDYNYATAAVRRLRRARVRGLHGTDSTTLQRYTALCAELLDASRATALHLPDAQSKLDSADAASRTLEMFFPALGANLVVARLAEQQGDLPLALRALRRRAGMYGLFPSWYLSTYLREEGRLAALTGDRSGALRAYQHYLALRPDPEPEVRPEVEGVRAERAKLLIALRAE